MPAEIYNSIQEEVLALKKKRSAVILAHNYQVGEIQDVADFTGDSLGLARKAQNLDADVIVFSGVMFMAETVGILCPDKTVLIPDLDAGCSLAGMITPEDVREWKAEYPKGVVVAYVNTTAAVKAESDICCTSSNAVKIVESIPKDKEILFIPDFYLGTFVQEKTGRKNMTLWKGYCHVHVMIRPERIAELKKEHNKAELIMHPECGCLTKSMRYADQILSTEGMVQYVRGSHAPEFIVATETGILHKMRKENPEKNFIPVTDHAICNYMKQNTLEKVVLSLEHMQYEIKVSDEIRRRALQPIQRMLEVTSNGNGRPR
ncbi:MAG: quinolinate synthase NadA [Candidatus Omnitrophica bacterium]|nr:quinolinate synthase NadA [Candidatus Omnitrophota bacterium]